MWSPRPPDEHIARIERYGVSLHLDGAANDGYRRQPETNAEHVGRQRYLRRLFKERTPEIDVPVLKLRPRLRDVASPLIRDDTVAHQRPDYRQYACVAEELRS